MNTVSGHIQTKGHERTRVAYRAGGRREGLLSQLLTDVINGEIPEVSVDVLIDVISVAISDVISRSGCVGL